MPTKRTTVKSRNVTERHGTGEFHARVTGRMMGRVLADWRDHNGQCAPSDHESDRDARACARGEHA